MSGNRIVILTIFLVVVGLILFINIEDMDNGLAFYITYLALTYSVMSSMHKSYEARKRVRLIHVSGSCSMDLSLNLSRKLKEMEEKKLLVRDIQVINEQAAIITFVR